MAWKPKVMDAPAMPPVWAVELIDFNGNKREVEVIAFSAKDAKAWALMQYPRFIEARIIEGN